MLNELHIDNIAVIEHSVILFDRGLNVLGDSTIANSLCRHFSTSSLVTNMGLFANDVSTVLVKATGSELDIMISTASGERNMFLLAAVKNGLTVSVSRWTAFALPGFRRNR